MQIDGVSRYVSPGLQLLFPIFRGTTLKRVTTNIMDKTKTETGDNIFSLHQSKTQEREVSLRVGYPSKDLPKYFDWREPNKVFFIRIRIGIMTVDVTLIVTIIL